MSTYEIDFSTVEGFLNDLGKTESSALLVDKNLI